MRHLLGVAIVMLLVAARLAADEPASSPAPGGIEFFEKRIRPLLADNCYQCHGPKKQESSLALNSAAALKRGGDRGPPIAPGDPDASLLIQAVRYTDDDLKMPPRGKLKEEQIADLEAWIKLGAPTPPEDDATLVSIRPSSDFNLAERSKHWAYQPVRAQSPPLAGTKPGFRSANPIDDFVFARLDAAGLLPAAAAEKRTLIRRLAFDLTGLPPTPAEVSAFLADQAPDAYERLVDRLLASPAYGERFARHWLDVVRYSESLGFEFDYDLHNAWRYRDYVIRAFNSDVPYNQFVIEHLAGDLVREPRRHPLDGTDESILATGFWWMYEGKQTPVDIRQYQADCIDNQLDVLGKAFLGQTIACARCHDHKFDAIATRDYYALAGYLKSSRYQQAFIDPPDEIVPTFYRLTKRRNEIDRSARSEVVKLWMPQAAQASKYLLAAARLPREAPKDERRPRNAEQREQKDDKADEKIAEIARESGLDAARLKQWIKGLSDPSSDSPDHPLYAFAHRIPRASAEGDATREGEAPAEPAVSARQEARTPVNTFNDWFRTGHAFNVGSPAPGEAVVGTSAARPVARLTVGGADSGVDSLRLQGEMRSPSFTLEKKFVHFRLAGRNARVNLVIDGYTLIMNPMYGRLTIAPASDRLVWRTMPVDRWVGHRAFIEASDSTIPMHGLNPPPSPARMPVGPDGYLAIEQIVFSDVPEPPAAANSLNEAASRGASSDDLDSLAAAYQRLIVEIIEQWRSGKLDSDDRIALVNWLLENGLLDAPVDQSPAPIELERIAALVALYQEAESSVPMPQRAPALADGTGEDEFVFLRGNYRALGERAPRDLPQVLPCSAESQAGEGSGRLELAYRLVDARNPLLPRVIVNRLWQHHFGEGIVRTPDDFGRMGQPPTHPELLDYLAAELIRGDWSLKRATRQMVAASVYRQRSAEPRTLNPERSTIDPDNRLLSRMPIRRLEAEAVRDSMLAASGRLSSQMYGPSVLPHITAHMEGRGKPQSGPLDGEGRRSMYINARRNFLTPLLLSFDYPVTFTPIGRRGTSNIPSQALTLMNDPFVVGQAQRWAETTLAESDSSAERRITLLFETAFARPPTADELASAIDFLQEQSLRHGTGSDDPRVWTDLCHVLINVKEFIFIE